MSEIDTRQGGLVDRNVPSQLDEEDLLAEIEIELPGSQNDVVAMLAADDVGSIEIVPEEDGGVIVDFDPQADRGPRDTDFFANLAEDLPDRELARISNELLGEYDANKASRKDLSLIHI